MREHARMLCTTTTEPCWLGCYANGSIASDVLLCSCCMIACASAAAAPRAHCERERERACALWNTCVSRCCRPRAALQPVPSVNNNWNLGWILSGTFWAHATLAAAPGMATSMSTALKMCNDHSIHQVVSDCILDCTDFRHVPAAQKENS